MNPAEIRRRALIHAVKASTFLDLADAAVLGEVDGAIEVADRLVARAQAESSASRAFSALFAVTLTGAGLQHDMTTTERIT